MSDGMNDALHGTNWERRIRAEKPKKKIVHSTDGKPPKAFHVAKPLSGREIRRAIAIKKPKKKVVKKKEVKPVMVMKTESFIRWVIYERTDEGRLLHPTYREKYEHNDSLMFDRNGYESLEEAHKAILKFTLREEEDMRWCESVYNGRTSGFRNRYLVIPECYSEVYREVLNPTLKETNMTIGY